MTHARLQLAALDAHFGAGTLELEAHGVGLLLTAVVHDEYERARLDAHGQRSAPCDVTSSGVPLAPVLDERE